MTMIFTIVPMTTTTTTTTTVVVVVVVLIVIMIVEVGIVYSFDFPPFCFLLTDVVLVLE